MNPSPLDHGMVVATSVGAGQVCAQCLADFGASPTLVPLIGGLVAFGLGALLDYLKSRRAAKQQVQQ